MKICGTVRRPVMLHHRVALRRVEVDADLVDGVDAALLEQRLGAHAERADLGGVHANGFISSVLHCSCRAFARRNRGAGAAADSGRATSPPAGWRRARPRDRRPAAALLVARLRSSPAARAARAARAGTPAPAAASCSSAVLARLRAWPAARCARRRRGRAAYSSGSLTSISTAFSRLISRTASWRRRCRRRRGPCIAATAASRPRPGRPGPDIQFFDQELVTRCRSHGTVCERARIIEFAPFSRSAHRDCRHVQARPDPPRRIHLEPREPLHRLDRRRADRHRRRAGARGRAAAEGSRLRVRRRYTSVLKRAIWTLWHALDADGPHLAAGGQRLAPERAPLRRAAGPEQGRDGAGSTATSRCWSGAAATTRRRRRSSPTIRAASAATRATRGSTPAQIPLTECLKDTVARVLPCWNEMLAPAIRVGPARADRRARQLDPRAGEVPRRHQRRRHRRAQHPQRHPAGVRARRRS